MYDITIMISSVHINNAKCINFKRNLSIFEFHRLGENTLASHFKISNSTAQMKKKMKEKNKQNKNRSYISACRIQFHSK